MASFGLGTVPVMFLTGAFANRFKHWIQKSAVRSIAALLVIAFGMWTMVPPLLHLAGKHTHQGDQHKSQSIMEHNHHQ
jgi:sulfite exporter TauE/SafE